MKLPHVLPFIPLVFLSLILGCKTNEKPGDLDAKPSATAQKGTPEQNAIEIKKVLQEYQNRRAKNELNPLSGDEQALALIIDDVAEQSKKYSDSDFAFKLSSPEIAKSATSFQDMTKSDNKSTVGASLTDDTSVGSGIAAGVFLGLGVITTLAAIYKMEDEIKDLKVPDGSIVKTDGSVLYVNGLEDPNQRFLVTVVNGKPIVASEKGNSKNRVQLDEKGHTFFEINSEGNGTEKKMAHNSLEGWVRVSKVDGKEVMPGEIRDETFLRADPDIPDAFHTIQIKNKYTSSTVSYSLEDKIFYVHEGVNTIVRINTSDSPSDWKPIPLTFEGTPLYYSPSCHLVYIPEGFPARVFDISSDVPKPVVANLQIDGKPSELAIKYDGWQFFAESNTPEKTRYLVDFDGSKAKIVMFGNKPVITTSGTNRYDGSFMNFAYNAESKRYQLVDIDSNGKIDFRFSKDLHGNKTTIFLERNTIVAENTNKERWEFDDQRNSFIVDENNKTAFQVYELFDGQGRLIEKDLSTPKKFGISNGVFADKMTNTTIREKIRPVERYRYVGVGAFMIGIGIVLGVTAGATSLSLTEAGKANSQTVTSYLQKIGAILQPVI